MKEIKAILEHFKPELKSYALATVVRVEGSSYRRMGARMLIADDGTFAGGISGGCLEGDALKRARLAIFKNQASIITYDTSKDNEHQIGVGLGCNGIIDVMFKPINIIDENNVINQLRFCANGPRKTNKLISIINAENVDLIGNLYVFGKDLMPDFVQNLNKKIKELNQSSFVKIDENTSIFIEVLNPIIHVFICGHQYDMHALIKQIELLGWSYTLVAPSVKAESYIHIDDINKIVSDSHSVGILMSHSLETDKKNLVALENKNLPYIGLLGPKVRAEKILKELDASGQKYPDISTLHYPVGLDIGATNPEEIALSIVAEIKAFFAKRPGNSLKLRIEPINDRVEY